jgi:hypothetical protein
VRDFNPAYDRYGSFTTEVDESLTTIMSASRRKRTSTDADTTMITIGGGAVAWALAARANIQKRAAG